MRARNVDFTEKTYELSDDITQTYAEIKCLYKKLSIDFAKYGDSRDKAPVVLKQFLSFYLKSEMLLLSLFNEMFKPHFSQTINRRKSIFVILNKLMKIFISVDCLRLRHPEIFCQFSFFKMHHGEEMDDICTEVETQRLSILGCISLPMGRLVLSIFATNKLELFYPTLLSKRTRIYLCRDRQKLLYMFARLTEMHNLKYISFYMGAVYKRFFGNGSYRFDVSINPALSEYLDLLQEHE